MAKAASVVIIGGGLGGLSAAIHLRLAGFEVTLYEANDRVGGRANLITRDGFRFDTGPSLLNYPWVFEESFRAAGRELRDACDCSRSTRQSAFSGRTGHASRSRAICGGCLTSASGSNRARARARSPSCATRRSSTTWPGVREAHLAQLRQPGSVARGADAGRDRPPCRLALARRRARAFLQRPYVREALGSYGTTPRRVALRPPWASSRSCPTVSWPTGCGSRRWRLRPGRGD